MIEINIVEKELGMIKLNPGSLPSQLFVAGRNTKTQEVYLTKDSNGLAENGENKGADTKATFSR